MSPALWLLAPVSRLVYRRVGRVAGRAGCYYARFTACCRGCGTSPRPSLVPRSFLVPRPSLVPCHSLVLCVLCPCLVLHPHSLIPRPSLLCATSLPHPHPHTLHTAPTPLPPVYLGCMMSQHLRAVLDASPLASVHVSAPACTCIRIIGLD